MSLWDTVLHVSQTEHSFFFLTAFCFSSGFYCLCFSRSDGCGFRKASTRRPKNCSVTMGTGVNQEFMKAKGFQFTTAKPIRARHLSASNFRGNTHAWKRHLSSVTFGYVKNCIHWFQTSLVSQLDSPNPTCNLWMYLHLHKLKQNVISMLNVF